MDAVAKQRVVIVVVVALMLLSRGFTAANCCAAVLGVAFFCWFVGRVERSNA